MKKSSVLCAFCALLFLIPYSVFSLEVSKTELESAGSADAVVFVNYSGPHAIINTNEEISGIGTELAKPVKVNPASSARAGDISRYAVIHAVDPTVKKGLDADILILGRNSGVDHIRNLRLIIQSYLMTAYNYSREDASTLSVFITVYNAVYRGKMDSYTAKYKQAVLDAINPQIVGLSTNYIDWAGKSQIVIPLFDPSDGGLSTIDTTIISDKKVVESMRESPDRSLEERKDMVDLKEREADQASSEAAAAQKEAVAARAEAEKADETAVIKEAEAIKADEKAQEARAEAEAVKAEAEAQPENKELQEKAAEAEEQAQQAEQKAEEIKTEAAEEKEKAQVAEEKAQEMTEKAAKEQVRADTKIAEAQEDRKEIAKDQKDIIAQTQKAAAPVETAYGLKLVDQSSLLSALVLVDKATGKIIQESPINVIRGRTVYKDGNNYIAVAGQTGGNAAIKLVLIDSKNMEITAQSAEDASAQSVLVEDSGAYYAVVKADGAWVIGKYDASLKLLAKSAAVLEQTPIIVKDGAVVATGSDNTVKVFDAKDLTVKQ